MDEKCNIVLVDGDDNYTVVYTGALDELFGCHYGKLPYRSMRFEWKYEEINSFQGAPLVAYPQEEGYTRIVEYKKLPPQEFLCKVVNQEFGIKGTCVKVLTF